MAPNPVGLIAYGLAYAAFAVVVLFAQRDRDFPLPLARRAGVIMLTLDSIMGWTALAADADFLQTPGWTTSLALVGAANLVAALGIFARGVSLPSWLRVGTAITCFVAPPILGVLTLS